VIIFTTVRNGGLWAMAPPATYAYAYVESLLGTAITRRDHEIAGFLVAADCPFKQSATYQLPQAIGKIPLPPRRGDHAEPHAQCRKRVASGSRDPHQVQLADSPVTHLGVSANRQRGANVGARAFL
jgi:hypothetical protein